MAFINREGLGDARYSVSGILPHLAAMRVWHVFIFVAFVMDQPLKTPSHHQARKPI